MALDHTALSSLAATLGEVTDRLAAMAHGLHDDDDDRGELREIERQLQTVNRRLAKMVHRTSRQSPGAR
jgi:uncharacterized protein YgfB (UPF0149 family)